MPRDRGNCTYPTKNLHELKACLGQSSQDSRMVHKGGRGSGVSPTQGASPCGTYHTTISLGRPCCTPTRWIIGGCEAWSDRLSSACESSDGLRPVLNGSSPSGLSYIPTRAMKSMVPEPVLHFLLVSKPVALGWISSGVLSHLWVRGTKDVEYGKEDGALAKPARWI